MPFFCLGQIKFVNSDESETIGKIAPIGQTLVECSRSGNIYTFTYKDVKYTTIDIYESFSFEDVNNAFDSLYDIIMKGLKEKRKNNIVVELPEGQGVFF